ncbi:uroporphyrinogen-III C-methyltransferase [Pseudomonas sp. N040]|uniref:uroporphyrinogen-III C-methyltransferase n=1 Tax=Pseudomonas sp. N040 TaxID=2785325 RepID=UPI0018A30542|nr:uroporphyrinogen-III C-methyltransferase [Pseudomonas sp. N040]MBF7730142.1 uroporphyrinogen-III C-methyltransferase [Pseudomonas sp. N040]MBW7013784.1 uroporphyrinogen-III C-methyltransferase [Pseudomonas sp. N040]
MSEAAIPVEPAVVSSRPPAAARARVPGRGLAWLALLVALLAAAAAGWGIWQQQQLQARSTLQAQLDALHEQVSGLDGRGRLLQDRLANFAPVAELAAQQQLLTQLQGDQQALNQRVSRVLGASRQSWRLAEAEHLLRLASLRLVALQDINSALVLVQGVNEILREQDDPDAFAAREQVAKLLQSLRSVEQPDRSGLFLQLAALREQVPGLQPLAPVFTSSGEVFASAAAEGDGSNRLAQWRERLSRYFRIQLDASQDVRPLLAGEQLDQVRLALSLALEQAQWAALNADAKVYPVALRQAAAILQATFQQDNAQARALLASIEQLASQPVSISVPDLQPALAALQAYIARRLQAEEQPAAAAPGEQP